MTNYNKDIQESVRNVVNEYFSLQMQDPLTRYYLYYNPNGYIDLKIATNRPDGYVLGNSECIGRGLTKEQVMLQLINTVRTLPVLNEV